MHAPIPSVPEPIVICQTSATACRANIGCGSWLTYTVSMGRTIQCRRLNLASFVTTWMEPECEALMTESYNINYIDESEYPSTTSIQNRRVPQQL